MDLRKVIMGHSGFDEDSVVYAERIDGRFLSSSKAVVLRLTKEEQSMNTNEIASRNCLGFSYFLEMSIIREMMDDMKRVDPHGDDEQRIETIIHYGEFDA